MNFAVPLFSTTVTPFSAGPQSQVTAAWWCRTVCGNAKLNVGDARLNVETYWRLARTALQSHCNVASVCQISWQSNIHRLIFSRKIYICKMCTMLITLSCWALSLCSKVHCHFCFHTSLMYFFTFHILLRSVPASQCWQLLSSDSTRKTYWLHSCKPALSDAWHLCHMATIYYYYTHRQLFLEIKGMLQGQGFRTCTSMWSSPKWRTLHTTVKSDDCTA